jgi:hypothetical protein
MKCAHGPESESEVHPMFHHSDLSLPLLVLSGEPLGLSHKYLHRYSLTCVVSLYLGDGIQTSCTAYKMRCSSAPRSFSSDHPEHAFQPVATWRALHVSKEEEGTGGVGLSSTDYFCLYPGKVAHACTHAPDLRLVQSA